MHSCCFIATLTCVSRTGFLLKGQLELGGFTMDKQKFSTKGIWDGATKISRNQWWRHGEANKPRLDTAQLRPWRLSAVLLHKMKGGRGGKLDRKKKRRERQRWGQDWETSNLFAFLRKHQGKNYHIFLACVCDTMILLANLFFKYYEGRRNMKERRKTRSGTQGMKGEKNK